MMKTKNKKQRAAVLVVALVMLSMVTFMVVALVGFSRHERVSVTASMSRTENGFGRKVGIIRAQQKVIDEIIENRNHGLMISQNSDGANVVTVPTNLAELFNFANGLTNNARPPVFIDRFDTNGLPGRDGILDTFPFYLDLNSATNLDGSTYQMTGTNKLGVRFQGDPHWIGLLEYPGHPHARTNKFIARYASMTVPMHKTLNIRYHHNNLKQSIENPNFDRFKRVQGLNPQEINLAAPLGMLDPRFFPYDKYNPYANAASIPAGIGSAFSHATALSHFGHDIEDAYYLSRPSTVYNDLLEQYEDRQDFDGVAVRHLMGLKSWLNGNDPNQEGVRMNTPPYSYYQFMELFSSTPLPAEPENNLPNGSGKFDISSIRPEARGGYARIDPQRHELVYIDQDHGLESGDKVHFYWSDADGYAYGAARVVDPIEFKTVLGDGVGAPSMARISSLHQGNIATSIPHRLIPREQVSFEPFRYKNGNSFPYQPIMMVNGPTDIPYWVLAANVYVFSTGDHSLKLGTYVGRNRTPYPVRLGYYDSDKKIWIPKSPVDSETNTLWAVFDELDLNIKLKYREGVVPIDRIPYFVKVIDPERIRLYRSAELNDLDRSSKVIFGEPERYIPRPGFDYVGMEGEKTGLWRRPVRDPQTGAFVASPHDFYQGDYVHFTGESRPTIQGGNNPVAESDIFTVRFHDAGTISLYRDNSPVFFEEAGGGAASYSLQRVYAMQVRAMEPTVEQMAGRMLNESLDTTGGEILNRNGQVIGSEGPIKHSLNGTVMEMPPSPNDPTIRPLIPLQFGLGGHQPNRGPWHRHSDGIPWERRELNPATGQSDLKFGGNYTREIDRIFQVAANIGDLFSGYNGPNLPIGGKIDVASCYSWSYGKPGILTLGDFTGDASISASIKQGAGPHGHSGLALCVRSDQKDPHAHPAYIIRYMNSGAWGKTPGKARIELYVHGKGVVAVSEEFDEFKKEDFFHLKATCEGGKKVKVFLDNRQVINYEHDVSLVGQAGLYAANGGFKYKNISPGFLKSTTKSFGHGAWSLPGRTDRVDTLPTAYKGVFRRDANNNLFLTGFDQRQDSLYGSDVSDSWYQRGAPVVIGVKDRSIKARPMPGQNMHAAITEVALRVNFHSQSQKLHGRLGMEVHVPEAFAVGTSTPSATYTINVRAKIVSGDYVVVRTDSNGVTGDRSTQPLVPGEYFMVNGSVSGTGRHTFIFSPAGADKGDGFLPLSGDNISVSDGVNSLTDIRIENLQLKFEGEIRVGDRVVDYFNDTLQMPRPIRFANPPPLNNEWPFVPTWKATDDYGEVGNAVNPRRVIHNNMYWYLNVPDLPGNPKNKPPGVDSRWKKLPWDLRKIEISWQANDPLVNSHGSDFKVYGYSPPNLIDDEKGGFKLKYSGNVTYRSWMPYDIYNQPFQFDKLPSVQAKFNWRLGVNLNIKNDATRAWVNGGDSAIQDPGVGYTSQPNLDWRFPDISRGRIKNLGWLGQVHRGTPWQTLYLKSKVPGLIYNITAVNSGVVTAPNHNIRQFDQVRITGKCPPEWLNLPFELDSAGNIKEGELEGFAQVLSADQFRIWPTDDTRNWVPDSDVLPKFRVADTTKLTAQNIQYWKNWARSSDTMPANDRRLLEAFTVGAGVPVRGRFSVNNDSAAAWSAVLSGLSVPLRTTKNQDGMLRVQSRFVGSNIPDRFPDREARIDLNDGLWGQIVTGINTIRGTNTFSRVSDILAATQLTDGSPYLPLVWDNTAEGFKDELDIERIPMQLLSLLRVDDQPRFETYIFAENLRPALRIKVPGYSGPAISENGTILNYEVAGQSARRVIYELSGAKEWHRSIKDGILGKWRDREGKLRPLTPMRPIILHSATLQMN